MAKRAFKKIYIKKSYHAYNANNLFIFAMGVASKLSGYTLVPVPIVTLVLFGTQITTLSGIITERQTDSSTTLEQDELNAMTIIVDSLDALADQLAWLANQATPGDEAAISSAIIFVGYELKDPSARQEQIFEVIDTEHEQATITYPIPDAKPRGNIYICAYTTTPLDATSWSAPVMTTESKVTLTGLVADKRGYFRKAIIPAQGRNPVVNVNNAEINWDLDIISALIP